MWSYAVWADADSVSTARSEWTRSVPRQLHGNLRRCRLWLENPRICGDTHDLMAMLPLTSDRYSSEPLATLHRRTVYTDFETLSRSQHLILPRQSQWTSTKNFDLEATYHQHAILNFDFKMFGRSSNE